MATIDDVITQMNSLNQGLGRVIQALKAVFPNSGGTAITATSGSHTLPANPVGFIIVTLPDGTTGKVPYYGL